MIGRWVGGQILFWAVPVGRCKGSSGVKLAAFASDFGTIGSTLGLLESTLTLLDCDFDTIADSTLTPLGGESGTIGVSFKSHVVVP